MKARFDTSGGLSSSDHSFIESNYERILSKPFSRTACGQCYKDAFVEMYLHVKKNGIKEMGKFILRRETLLHIAGDSQVYTRVNMTDEFAVQYLSQFPDAIHKFESYPDNWEQLVAGASAKPQAQGSLATAEEQDFVTQLAAQLKAGTTKTTIREQYKTASTSTGKKLTARELNELIRRAEAAI